jgi:hypothetical protein
MPFDGYPVFQLPTRGRLVIDCRSSRRLPRPSRALTRNLPAVSSPASESGSHRLSADARAAALLSVCHPSAHAAERFLHGGVARSRRSPLVAFLRLQRAVPLRATLSTCRVCFTPATLLGFRLQGFQPPGDRDPVSGLPSSRAASRRALPARAASKG